MIDKIKQVVELMMKDCRPDEDLLPQVILFMEGDKVGVYFLDPSLMEYGTGAKEVCCDMIKKLVCKEKPTDFVFFSFAWRLQMEKNDTEYIEDGKQKKSLELSPDKIECAVINHVNKGGETGIYCADIIRKDDLPPSLSKWEFMDGANGRWIDAAKEGFALARANK